MPEPSGRCAGVEIWAALLPVWFLGLDTGSAFWEAPRLGKGFGVRLFAGWVPVSLRADAARGTVPGRSISPCPPRMGERLAGRLQPAAPCREAQPAPKLGMVGLCLALKLGACSSGAGGPPRGAGGYRADGSALPAGRASLHDKASLRIEQVRSEDQGWYECKVLMLDQQYDTFHNGSWVHLTVNGELGRGGAAASPGGGGAAASPGGCVRCPGRFPFDFPRMLDLDGVCALQTSKPEAIQADCSSRGVT